MIIMMKGGFVLTTKEREILLSWIINEKDRIDNEVNELRTRLRFRRIDISDCVELSFAMQRKEDFEEFALIVLRLLRLDG